MQLEQKAQKEKKEEKYVISPLQQDSERRIREYQQERDQAKEQGKAAKARDWAKALEEEQKILKMIKRVELFNATH